MNFLNHPELKRILDEVAQAVDGILLINSNSLKDNISFYFLLLQQGQVVPFLYITNYSIEEGGEEELIDEKVYDIIKKVPTNSMILLVLGRRDDKYLLKAYTLKKIKKIKHLPIYVLRDPKILKKIVSPLFEIEFSVYTPVLKERIQTNILSSLL